MIHAPHSHECEQAVLAAAMLDPSALAAVCELLSTDDFHSQRHRIIWLALRDLARDEVAIDLRTVQAALEERGQLDTIGGLPYLSELDLSLPDTSRVGDYIGILRDRSTRRKMLAFAAELTREATSDAPAIEVVSSARVTLERIESTAAEIGGQLAPIGDGVDDLIRSIDRTSQQVAGIGSGFVDLDRLTGGFGGGQLWIIAGRPGMGKTALALAIIEHACLLMDHTAGVASLEMSRLELGQRITASVAKVDHQRMRTGMLGAAERAKAREIAEQLRRALIYLDDGRLSTSTAIAAAARRQKISRGLDLLVIDYLQLLQPAARMDRRDLEISHDTRALKLLARELDVPVILLSQLNRESERGNRAPGLSDLRESGSIEQDADGVMFLWRDPNGQSENEVELLVAKNRHGPTGAVPLYFRRQYVRFENGARGGFDATN